MSDLSEIQWDRSSLVTVAADASEEKMVAELEQLTRYLNQRVPLRQPLSLRLPADLDTGAWFFIGEIGLQHTLASVAGTPQRAVDLLIGDAPPGSSASRPHMVGGVLWSELPDRLVSLLRAYVVEQCPRETLLDYANRVGLDGLQQRLGLPPL